MLIAFYFGLLLFAVVCSLIHVLKQSNTDVPPGEIIIRTFFLCFIILGIGCIWLLLSVPNELTQGLGILGYGVSLGIITQSSIHLTFFIKEKKIPIKSEVKIQNNQETPRYI